jgi:hypothetical protein
VLTAEERVLKVLILKATQLQLGKYEVEDQLMPQK